MGKKTTDLSFGVVQWVMKNMQRWYSHVRRMLEDRKAKKVYQNSVVGTCGGKPPVMGGKDGTVRKRKSRWRRQKKTVMLEKYRELSAMAYPSYMGAPRWSKELQVR